MITDLQKEKEMCKNRIGCKKCPHKGTKLCDLIRHEIANDYIKMSKH